MVKTITDSQSVKIYRQAATLGRMAEEGKRDPEWVSGVLQSAIEHREDGRIDFVQGTTVIDLGEFDVDYETPLAELASGIESFNPYYELFETQPKPMYYSHGLWEAEFFLVNFTFREDQDFRVEGPLLDEVRALLTRRNFVPAQIRELIAVLKGHEPGQLNKIGHIAALGCGVPLSGKINGTTLCTTEVVPVATRFHPADDFKLETEPVSRNHANSGDHFLVRKVEGARLGNNF